MNSTAASRSSKPLAILSAPGSRGDVHPMVAIGESLLRRGYEVHISMAEPYVELAQAVGLSAHSVVDRQRFDELLGDQNVWKPFRGARRIFAWSADEFATAHLRLIEQLASDRDVILVSHPLDFASRIYREFYDVPLVDVHLAPSMLRPNVDPPRMTPFWFEFRRPPWLVRWAYRCVDRFLVDPVVVGPLNRLRQQTADASGRKMGTVPPVRRILHRWWLSPDRVLAMYPDWFAPSIESAYPTVRCCGFPLRDDFGHDDKPTTSAENKSPVVFTSGTAHQHATEFFEAACQFCQRSDRPGWLLSSHTSNIPQRVRDGGLMPLVSHHRYLPLSEVLPQAAAVVHHGGIGTTAAALAAGCPQIILPMAFDQFDNARRIEQFGVGISIRNHRHLQGALTSLLADPRYDVAAKRFADRMRTEPDAVERAVDHIVETKRRFESQR